MVGEAPAEPTAPTDVADAPAFEESADADSGDGGRLEVTETNVQERGVDEQDRVKVSSDGSSSCRILRPSGWLRSTQTRNPDTCGK